MSKASSYLLFTELTDVIKFVHEFMIEIYPLTW